MEFKVLNCFVSVLDVVVGILIFECGYIELGTYDPLSMMDLIVWLRKTQIKIVFFADCSTVFRFIKVLLCIHFFYFWERIFQVLDGSKGDEVLSRQILLMLCPNQAISFCLYRLNRLLITLPHGTSGVSDAAIPIINGDALMAIDWPGVEILWMNGGVLGIKMPW